MGLESLLFSVDGITLSVNEQMKKHLSMGVGGYARYYISVDNVYALMNTISLLQKKGVPYKVLGNGTNVIVSDKGYDGAIISLKELNGISFVKNGVKAESGVNLNKLIDFASQMNLGGMSYLYNIPSSVGGAVFMNCGAFNRSVSDFIVEVQTLKNGKIKTYGKSECKFGYRASRFQKSKEIILGAVFSFERADGKETERRIAEVKDKRRDSQPKEKSSGCTFKNPEGFSAGKLIDDANLKGLSVGGAKVSVEHANFIVNTGSATAKDVYDLSQIVKNIVKEKYGVDLQYEVEFLGEF